MGTSNDQTQPGGALPGYLTAQKNSLCIADTTPRLLKAAPGTIVSVSILTAGSGTGAVYDAATTASISGTANEVAAIPMTAGITTIQFPCLTGIVVQAGTGQKISVAYT